MALKCIGNYKNASEADFKSLYLKYRKMEENLTDDMLEEIDYA